MYELGRTRWPQEMEEEYKAGIRAGFEPALEDPRPPSHVLRTQTTCQSQTMPSSVNVNPQQFFNHSLLASRSAGIEVEPHRPFSRAMEKALAITKALARLKARAKAEARAKLEDLANSAADEGGQRTQKMAHFDEFVQDGVLRDEDQFEGEFALSDLVGAQTANVQERAAYFVGVSPPDHPNVLRSRHITIFQERLSWNEWTCMHCNRTFDSVEALKGHFKTIPEASKKKVWKDPFRCNFCGYVISGFHDFREHQTKDHEMELQGMKMQPMRYCRHTRAWVPRSYRCPVADCGKMIA